MNPRLGVNIDHVATLRQARGEAYPSLVEAADHALNAGADQITIHLREDRRHIQDTDVPAIQMVTQRYGKPLNLELGANEDIMAVAMEVKPQWYCLVPEKREERTTEGGLDLKSAKNFEKIKASCAQLKENHPEAKISLFVESDLATLEQVIKCDVDAVEIHTGDFAMDFIAEESLAQYFTDYKLAYDLIKENNLGFHAGHGLTDQSLQPLVQLGLFEEYNIGHWIICDSVFCGLTTSINKLKKILENKR
ncbi:MAG: pyridoxine 5'-phosphate synthase [Halobacteriovoraceae bacterium]|nr:pyridoxine 5'-phosphate synthase [Halobacteriovoraceae bacterium]|tara:strand:+ start:11460 stop:12209 length:750 start_codon:yes stop_codon:yes gene_type:complete